MAHNIAEGARWVELLPAGVKLFQVHNENKITEIYPFTRIGEAVMLSGGGKILAFLLLAISLSATADDAQESLLVWEDIGWLKVGGGSPFRVSIVESDRDKCWTNQDAVKTVVELELKRSSYKIANKGDLLPDLVEINTTAYEIKGTGTCVVGYELSVSVPSSDTLVSGHYKLNSIEYRTIWRSGGVLSGLKTQGDFRLKQEYVNLIQEFLNKVDGRRQAVLDEINKSTIASNEAKEYWAKAIK